LPYCKRCGNEYQSAYRKRRYRERKKANALAIRLLPEEGKKYRAALVAEEQRLREKAKRLRASASAPRTLPATRDAKLKAAAVLCEAADMIANRIFREW
jgi:hypothetical protein